MTISNPFSTPRWELESRHIVWVPPQAEFVLGRYPCHIQGVRGSGKTVLLKLADYYTRRDNKIELYNKTEIVDSCLGIYINFLREFSDFIDDPTRPNDYFNYVYAYSVAKICDLLDDASRDGILCYKVQEEKNVVVLAARHLHLPGARYSAPTRFSELAQNLQRYCQSLRLNSLVGPHAEAEEEVSGLRLYNDFCIGLGTHSILSNDEREFHIKICLDDTHLLGPETQKKLNFILSQTNQPVFWNIAFVEGQFDPSTIMDGKSFVTSHDRKIVDLNYRLNDREFERTCKSIFTLRAKRYLEEKYRLAGSNQSFELTDPRLWLTTYCPMYDYSRGFIELLEQSNRTKFKDSFASYQNVLESAWNSRSGKTARSSKQQLKQNNSNQDVKEGSFGNRIAKSYYQAYIASKIFASPVDFQKFLAERSLKQSDNYFRQKIAAALILASREAGKLPQYYGANTIYRLADGSLRNFLLFCEALFKTAELASDGNSNYFFLGKQLPNNLQANAILKFSKEFAAGLKDFRQPFATPLSNLLSGLGKLTYLLQTEDARTASQVPDRGLFRVGIETKQRELFDQDQGEFLKLLRSVLKEAVYTGAIRLEDGNFVKGTSFVFRLSAVLSPAFEISQRRPLRTNAIHYRAIQSLLDCKSPREAENWAKSQFRTINLDNEEDSDLDLVDLFDGDLL